MNIGEYKALIENLTGVNISDDLLTEWSTFESEPTEANLSQLIASIENRAAQDIANLELLRRAFSDLTRGVEPSGTIPFAVRIHKPTQADLTDSADAINSEQAVLQNIMNPKPFGDLSTRHDDGLGTDIYFPVTPLTRIDKRNNFEEVPQDAQAIVFFFHGSGTYTARGTNFFKEMNQLARYGVASISFDLPHHGNGPRDGDYRPDEFADWVRRIVLYYKELYPGKKIVLAGHSFGPSVIVNYLTRYPDSHGVDGAVLLSPGGPFSEEGARHHALGYVEWLSDWAREDGFPGFNKQASRWTVMEQASWEFGSPGILENINIPVFIFAGDKDPLYPNVQYLMDASARMRADLKIGHGVKHHIFELDEIRGAGEDRKRAEAERDDVYKTVFGPGNADIYAGNGLRFISAVVIDFLKTKIGLQIPVAEGEAEAKELYASNADFRRMIDRQLLKEAKKTLFEEVKNSNGRSLLLTALGREEIQKMVTDTESQWPKLGKKQKTEVIYKIAEAIGIEESAGKKPEMTASVNSARSGNSELFDALSSRLGQVQFKRLTVEEQKAWAEPLSRIIEGVYKGEVIEEIPPETLIWIGSVLEGIPDTAISQLSSKRVVANKFDDWKNVRMALRLYDSEAEFREMSGNTERSELLNSATACDLLAKWNHVRTALLLYDGNPVFHSHAGVEKSELLDPEKAGQSLNEWDRHRLHFLKGLVRSIPTAQAEFYSDISNSDNRLGLSKSEFDETAETIESEVRSGRPATGKSKERMDQLLGKIGAAYSRYLSLKKAELNLQSGSVVNSYSLVRRGVNGEEIKNEWRYKHTRLGYSAMYNYQGAVPYRPWYREYLAAVDGPLEQPVSGEDYLRTETTLRERIHRFNNNGLPGDVRGGHVLSICEGGDLLIPSKLFQETDHITVLAPSFFGKIDSDNLFTPHRLHRAHALAAGQRLSGNPDFQHPSSTGVSYLNFVVAALAHESSPDNVMSVFYFSIIAGEKVYVSSKSFGDDPENYRNAEITFKGRDGRVKTLDIIADEGHSLQVPVRRYLVRHKPDAIFIGSHSSDLNSQPSALRFMRGLLATGYAPLVSDGRAQFVGVSARPLAVENMYLVPSDAILVSDKIDNLPVDPIRPRSRQSLFSEMANNAEFASNKFFGGSVFQKIAFLPVNIITGGLVYTAGELGSDALLGRWDEIAEMSVAEISKEFGLLTVGSAAGNLTAKGILNVAGKKLSSEIVNKILSRGIPLFSALAALEVGETGTVDVDTIPVSMANVAAASAVVGGVVAMANKTRLARGLIDVASAVASGSRIAKVGGSFVGLAATAVAEFTVLKMLAEVEGEYAAFDPLNLVTARLGELIKEDLELLGKINDGEDVDLKKMQYLENLLLAYGDYINTGRAEAVAAEENAKFMCVALGTIASDGAIPPPYMYDTLTEGNKLRTKSLLAEARTIADVRTFTPRLDRITKNWEVLHMQFDWYLKDRNQLIAGMMDLEETERF